MATCLAGETIPRDGDFPNERRRRTRTEALYFVNRRSKIPRKAMSPLSTLSSATPAASQQLVYRNSDGEVELTDGRNCGHAVAGKVARETEIETREIKIEVKQNRMSTVL